MEIISKRHPYKFYLLIFLMNSFFLGIGSIFVSASIRDKNGIGFLIFIVFVLLIIYFDFILIKNSTKIIINEKGIIYKKEINYWKDIHDIKLTGKRGLILNTPTECATLKFKNSKTIIIFDDLYSNSAEIKCFINDFVVDKNEKNEMLESDNIEVDLKNEIFIMFKGNAVFSFRGLFMWLFILSFLLIPFFSKKPFNNDFFLILIIPIFWFVFNSFMMFYFQMSKNYFVIKNHYFFWVFNIFKISEIKEIVFEQSGKQPNCLKIINNNFKTKSYFAGSLTDKTWIKMKTDFESRNIKVRNECIAEN